MPPSSPTHGGFKVADTVCAEEGAKDYTREEWEAALDKAKQRAEPDEWPLIIVDDFLLISNRRLCLVDLVVESNYLTEKKQDVIDRTI